MICAATDMTPHKRLSQRKIDDEIQKLDGWYQEVNALSKEYSRSSFEAAIAFIQELSRIAHAMNHYPDIILYSEKNVKVILTTPEARGITESDVVMARRIEEIR